MAQSEPREALELILGERLGRKEVERGRLGILDEPLEHRQVVAQALSARRSGHDHDVTAPTQGPDRFGLVDVEARDSLGLDRADDRFGQRRRQRPEARGARGDGVPVNQGSLVVGSIGQPAV